MQVLIIDDSVTARLAARYALAPLLLGAEFQQAHGGVHAQSLFAIQPPDLVVVDPGMKEGHGMEFIRWLRGQLEHQDTPILVHTAQEDTSLRLRLLAYQPISFVTKPGRARDFAEALEGLGMPAGCSAA
jgi:CheY-like chemotaxis protein